MKKPIRLFWCTLLLIAVGIFLRCKIMGHLNFLSRTGESVEFDVNQIHLNSTLLKFAETDISDSETRQEIEILLEGNFGVYGWRRSMSSWKRYNQDLSHRRGATKIPIQLRSPLFYRVWPEVLRSLRIWSTNRRFEPGIMKELIELIKHPLERYYGLKDSDLRYSSCAVVGNSGILLNDNHGELIDSHEIVIRLNNARISGYQSNVGSKTNISFVNSNILHLCARKERCFCHPYGENIPIIMYICQPLHFLDYTLCNATHKAPLLITDARLDNLCNRIVKYYSIKQFVEETGKPIEEWSSAHDGKFFTTLPECKPLRLRLVSVTESAFLGLENQLCPNITTIPTRKLNFTCMIMRPSMHFTMI